MGRPYEWHRRPRVESPIPIAEIHNPLTFPRPRAILESTDARRGHLGVSVGRFLCEILKDLNASQK